MSILRYAAKRILTACLTLFIVTILTFVLVRVLPGDPAIMILGQESTPEQLEAVRRDLGLHRPLYVQYIDWLVSFITGDFGSSYIYRDPVAILIKQRLPRSLLLAAAAITLSGLSSIPLGIIASRHKNEPLDYTISTFTLAGISVPNFYWGLVFILIFAVLLDLVPPSGYTNPLEDPVLGLKRLILPAAAVGWALMANVTRMIRSSMIEQYSKNYVMTLRAKGVSDDDIVYGHAIYNALLPTLTVMAMQIGTAFGGQIVIEVVFSWPGIGTLVYDAILNRDIPLIQATVVVIATMFITANFMADLLYAYIDPRIAYGGHKT